ncbi:NADH-cytochrome b5 reductase 2 [Oncorhynchus kisutch]|uniref:NADH-cytochrome b5 reductase 2 n=1 Tax=Oncorhynchus kisutch TaxID=8019 RepID=UPI0009A0176E|nr:NADH-cytochrome b5 reductase 2-like [Oncorhynchus kisutch]
MLQLIHSITADPADDTKCSLIFANQTKDILLREELEKVLKSHSEQLNLWFTIDRPPQDWKYSSGFVNADMMKEMKEHLPLVSNDVLIVMCGPLPMTLHPPQPLHSGLQDREHIHILITPRPPTRHRYIKTHQDI